MPSRPKPTIGFISTWPVPGPNINFVPVGPWNTDGLIIVPDELTQDQSQYVRDLLAVGFPLIFTTPEGPGPVVAVNNTPGIQQAFEHLLHHGHKQIAFIAGNVGQGGDSEERLQAYRLALKEAGIPEDPSLIAFGEHRRDGGRAAMQKILASGAGFSALLASNDLSCLGAIECLQESGRVIPDDVAVIGFDDILDARSLRKDPCLSESGQSFDRCLPNRFAFTVMKPTPIRRFINKTKEWMTSQNSSSYLNLGSRAFPSVTALGSY